MLRGARAHQILAQGVARRGDVTKARVLVHFTDASFFPGSSVMKEHSFKTIWWQHSHWSSLAECQVPGSIFEIGQLGHI